MSESTASVIIAAFALTGLVIALITVAANVSQALRRVVDFADSQSIAQQQRMKDLLDRLMAVRWEDYAALKSATEEQEDGGFFPPREGEEEGGQTGGRWGTLTPARSSPSEADTLAHEQVLLAEDFPDENR